MGGLASLRSWSRGGRHGRKAGHAPPRVCQPFCITTCCCSAEMNQRGSELECSGTSCLRGGMAAHNVFCPQK